MTALTTASSEHDAPTRSQEPTQSPRRRGSADPTLHWWREVVIVVVFYLGYSLIRNHFGSAAVSADEAFVNAQRVIGLEQHLGLFHEEAVQSWFVGWHPFIVLCNTFYGLMHFAVPLGVLLFVLVRWPADYRFLRNTLACTTGLALVGFSLFPLMPPRLLCDCAYGAGPGASQYGFVDTVATDGGFWSFGSRGVAAVSNQYAAMPSLHVAWALWCAFALVPRVRNRWLRALAAAYPAMTLFAVIVTANHFFLDAIGGAVVVGLGWWLGGRYTGWIESRRRSSSREDPSGVLVTERPTGVPLDSTSVDGGWTARAGRSATPAERETPLP